MLIVAALVEMLTAAAHPVRPSRASAAPRDQHGLGSRLGDLSELRQVFQAFMLRWLGQFPATLPLAWVRSGTAVAGFDDVVDGGRGQPQFHRHFVADRRALLTVG